MADDTKKAIVQFASDDLFVGALASGIRERDTRHLHTLELNRFSTSRDAEQLASVIGVDLDAAHVAGTRSIGRMSATGSGSVVPTEPSVV